MERVRKQTIKHQHLPSLPSSPSVPHAGPTTPESKRGSPKVHFPSRAVLFKGGDRAYAQFGRVLPPPPLWRGSSASHGSTDYCYPGMWVCGKKLSSVKLERAQIDRGRNRGLVTAPRSQLEVVCEQERTSPNPINHFLESRHFLVRSLPGFGAVMVQTVFCHPGTRP